MMPQEESEKYLSLLKKGLSGSLGKNLIDIVFSTQQVVDSEEHRLLTTLRDSQLKDNEARQTFYHKVIDSLDMGDSSYLLLLTCDSYDVPHRGKDDSLQADASDEVFTYIVCVVCPIKEGKVAMAGKARGLPGAYVALFKKIDELGGISPDFATVAGYSASLREVQPIQNYFRDTLDLPEPLVRQIGCVIGTHAGPGAFGLAFFDKGLVLE